MKRILVSALIAICLGLMQTPVSNSQTPSVEAQVKAAFLFNFAQFIQWPSQAFEGDSAFNICVTEGSIEVVLERILEGETLNGRAIAVRRLGPPEGVKGCHLVYVPRPETEQLTEIISAASSMPILTVGDSEDFIRAGGMIRFIERARRIRFEINPEAAEHASLRISSRLLRLADISRVRQGRALQ